MSNCTIKGNVIILGSALKFKYLRTLITPDGKCVSEINNRTEQAEHVLFVKL